MTISATHPFIGVDWSATGFRAALIAPDGEILDELFEPRGVSSFKPSEFAPYLISTCADFTRAGGQCFLLAGMIGSPQGMAVAPHCACPVSVMDLAHAVRWVSRDRVAIVPGLRFGQLDIMQGPEIQVFGAAAALGLHDALMVLPDVHCKWVDFENGAITGFTTWMTGEFYDLLASHALQAINPLAPAPEFEARIFLEGVDAACGGESLLHTAFSLRVKLLFNQLAPAHAASYLSGLVIGEELVSMQVQPGAELVLVGSQQLTKRYQLAFAHMGAQVRTLGQQTAWAGLHQVYQALARM